MVRTPRYWDLAWSHPCIYACEGGVPGWQRLSRCFGSDPRIRVGVSVSELRNSKRKGFALFSLIFKAEEKRALRALGPCWVSLLAGEPCPLGELGTGAALPRAEAEVRCADWPPGHCGEGASPGLEGEPWTLRILPLLGGVLVS